VIELCIRDNGQGFDPEKNFPECYGLNMMKIRAKAVGALLTITRLPHHGMELILRWTKPGKKEGI
jgi:signal transduction histidine kinase